MAESAMAHTLRRGRANLIREDSSSTVSDDGVFSDYSVRRALQSTVPIDPDERREYLATNKSAAKDLRTLHFLQAESARLKGVLAQTHENLEHADEAREYNTDKAEQANLEQDWRQADMEMQQALVNVRAFTNKVKELKAMGPVSRDDLDAGTKERNERAYYDAAHFHNNEVALQKHVPAYPGGLDDVTKDDPLAQAKKENQKLTDALLRMQDDVDRAMKDLCVCQTENAKYKAENTGLKVQIMRSQAAADEFERLAEIYQARLEQCNARLEDCNAELKGRQAQITRYQQRHESHDQGECKWFKQAMMCEQLSKDVSEAYYDIARAYDRLNMTRIGMLSDKEIELIANNADDDDHEQLAEASTSSANSPATKMACRAVQNRIKQLSEAGTFSAANSPGAKTVIRTTPKSLKAEEESSVDEVIAMCQIPYAMKRSNIVSKESAEITFQGRSGASMMKKLRPAKSIPDFKAEAAAAVHDRQVSCNWHPDGGCRILSAEEAKEKGKFCEVATPKEKIATAMEELATPRECVQY
jgi:hypothetical protein